MKAVVMAGGFGTRLRPLTEKLPKPMAHVANRPMMEHVVRLLAAEGIDGTAGAVKNAEDRLDGTFLVISADIITDFDLSKAIDFHTARKAAVTIVLTRVPNPLQYGIVITEDDGRIVRFLEKPTWGEVFSDTINTGIYIIEPEVLDLIPPKKNFDFSKNLFPAMLARGDRLLGYVAEGYWKDVGNLDEYLNVHLDLLAGKVKIGFEGEKAGTRSVWIGEGTKVDYTAELSNVLLGKKCVVGSGVTMRNVVVGDGCLIEDGTVIQSSVLWKHVSVGKGARILENIIGSDAPGGGGALLPARGGGVGYLWGAKGEEGGGVHIRKSPFDPSFVDLKFFDDSGLDLPMGLEKNIENLFFREDFVRADIEETGVITFPVGGFDLYIDGFAKSIDARAIKERNYNIVLDYSYGSAAVIFPRILGQLGVETVALNAILDPARITRTQEEFDRGMWHLSAISRSLNADFGAMLDTGGEKIFLVDEKGDILPDATALQVVCLLACRQARQGLVGVPVTASRNVERIAARFGMDAGRTRTLPRSLMAAAAREGGAFPPD